MKTFFLEWFGGLTHHQQHLFWWGLIGVTIFTDVSFVMVMLVKTWIELRGFLDSRKRPLYNNDTGKPSNVVSI